MKLYRKFLLPLALRLLISTVPFFIGWFLLTSQKGHGDLLHILLWGLGFVLFISPAAIIAPPIAHLFGMLSGNVLFPDSSEKSPRYSMAKARRSQGRFHDALREYDAILSEHPQDVQSYCDMLAIARSDLKNEALAQRIADRALSALKDPESVRKIRQLVASQ
jgi:hypothetical protein